MITIVAAAIMDTEGKIHYMSSPARHHHIIWWMRGRYDELTGMPHHKDFEDDEQGFITNELKFVNRIEAMQIAKAAGQVSNTITEARLFSEDLW